ncbi:MAG TPA: PAS domain-containing sensor histidine kinase [Prolixibacteraceae bacterium]|nr:PAS domain-containing sensor histidine kinase [Prolixibacteraceae bacterium]
MLNDQQDIKLSDNRSIPIDEFSHLVINNLVDYSIFTTDKDLIINSWYAGAAKLFGYSATEVIGKHIDILFTKEDINDRISTMEMEMALNDGWATDNRWHVLKDGKLFYAYGLMFPLRDARDELIGFIKILRDLTGRKINEDAIQKHIHDLEELMVHKENIIHILSHDLRSPLSYIVGVADYLKSDFNQMEPEELTRMLDALYQASTDELNMLDYLVEWARVKHASDIFTPVILDLKKVVMRVFETFNEMAAAKSIRLEKELEKGTIVFADEKMLVSILQNLVSNAIKFSPNETSIIITASEKEDKVTVKVKDQGIGIPQEKLDNLFKAQLNNLAATREENKGAGIGLLLVKGFVERNGGELCAESVEGQGSTFYFTLPANEMSYNPVSNPNFAFNKEA